MKKNTLSKTAKNFIKADYPKTKRQNMFRVFIVIWMYYFGFYLASAVKKFNSAAQLQCKVIYPKYYKRLKKTSCVFPLKNMKSGRNNPCYNILQLLQSIVAVRRLDQFVEYFGYITLLQCRICCVTNCKDCISLVLIF